MCLGRVNFIYFIPRIFKLFCRYTSVIKYVNDSRGPKQVVAISDSNILTVVREHPFNLKGGGVAMGFFVEKISVGKFD